MPSTRHTGDTAAAAPECADFGGMLAGAFGTGDGEAGLPPGCAVVPLPVPAPAPEPELVPVLVAGEGPPADTRKPLPCRRPNNSLREEPDCSRDDMHVQRSP